MASAVQTFLAASSASTATTTVNDQRHYVNDYRDEVEENSKVDEASH